MADLKKSTATTRLVLMVDASDHVTGLAGLTLTIAASKAGGAFGTITPTVADLGNGWYALALTAAHTDTLGDLALHVTAPTADPTDKLFNVVETYDANVTKYADIPVDAGFADFQGNLTAVDDTGAVTVVTGKAGVTLGENAVQDRYLEMLSGLGRGQVAIINASTTGSQFTLDRKWPITPAAGDAYQIGGVAEVTPVVLGASQPNYAPARVGDAMILAAAQPNYAPAKAGDAMVLAASQPNYAPAKAGDAMILAASQAFNNTGQTANLPANVKAYADVDVDASFADLQGELTAVDDTGTVTVLTGKAGVTFPGGALSGHYLAITSGDGREQTALIAANAGGTFTLDRKLAITPTVGDSYQVGGLAEVSPVVLAASERAAVANALLDLADGIEPGETLRQFLQNLRALSYGLAVPDFPVKGQITLYRKDGTTVALLYTIGDVPGHRTEVTAFNNAPQV